MNRQHAQYINSFRHRTTATVFAVLFSLGSLLGISTGFAADDATGSASLTRADSAFDLEKYMELVSASDTDIHELFFSTILYEGTQSCLMCHEEEGRMVLEMGHFKWQGVSERIEGLEGQVHGKNDLLNNFCIGVPSNEGRCTECHAGLGYDDNTFNFSDPANVDCLVCHDQSGTYVKGLTSAGMPDPGVDLNAVARSISLGGEPTRKNCISCHARAGGGDNVKHGDLSTDLVSTTREYDVHMGVDGADLSCTDCHGANHDPVTGAYNHGHAGMALHSVYEGEMKQCVDCHGRVETIHQKSTQEQDLFVDGWHDRLACQVCHIPAIARKVPTKVEWYWADAGQDITRPDDPETGMPTYAKKKGSFVWKNNVKPTLRYANGKWARKVIGVNDTYDSEPIVMGEPLGSHEDPEAMIYPFKKMIGNQPVDTVNQKIIVPHLFGKKGGPNPYWAKFDWNLALQDGAAYTGQPYSGTYGFAETEMLLSVNHEIAPAEEALGNGTFPENCLQCHFSDHIEWDKLGWTSDPLGGGDRR